MEQSTSERYRLLSGEFTYFPGVPTMFHYLLQATRGEAGLRFPNLRLCVSAGAIMPATLNRAFESHLGVPLLDGYGITETSTMVTMNWPTGQRVPGSCGFPVPGLAVRIVDANGRDVEANQEGELIVRGPNVMPGYHEQAGRETRSALRAGWRYHTGDLATERRERISDHHRPAQGAHHPRRPEYRAGRDRRGREHLRGRCSTAPWSACRTSISAKCRRCSWCLGPAIRS